MLFAFQPASLFVYITLAIGLLTTITDIGQKKIYNIHLILGAGLGLLAAWYVLLTDPAIIIAHLVNASFSLPISWLIYHFKLWRGGDAKLFCLYAFLMPPLGHGNFLFSGAISLFACSFIAGTIILIPLFIKDNAANYNTVIQHAFPLEKRKNLYTNIRITFLLSWILFPFYYFLRFIHIPVISLGITYIIFILANQFLREIRINNIAKISMIALGIFLRLWINPLSLSWPILPYSILRIVLLSVVSAYIYASLDLLKEYHERVAFAPLLFMGFLLSYTPFLSRITHLISR